jgi:predicted hotdog family 3-hydroxylacyl-ACP dehydratase
MNTLVFPINTRELDQYLPHRDPAIWIDEVVSVRADGGVCRVYPRKGGHYADASGRIRDSSFAEWVAQAYGFVAACQALSGLAPNEKRAEKVFLVQIRDLELSPDPAATLIFEGDWIEVRVKRTHRLGSLVLIEGEVFSSSQAPLARAKLKLYAE